MSRWRRLWGRIRGRRNDWQDVGYATLEDLLTMGAIEEDDGPWYGAECDTETLERIVGRVKVEILDGTGRHIRTVETDDNGVMPALVLPVREIEWRSPTTMSEAARLGAVRKLNGAGRHVDLTRGPDAPVDPWHPAPRPAHLNGVPLIWTGMLGGGVRLAWRRVYPAHRKDTP